MFEKERESAKNDMIKCKGGFEMAIQYLPQEVSSSRDDRKIERRGKINGLK